MQAHSTQYRLVQSIPLIPVGIAFICSFFLSDTPRWLASKDRGDEALKVLSQLRHSVKNDHRLSEEYEEIQEQIRMRQQSLAGVPIWTVIKEIAIISSYRKRFLLGVTMQTVAQWSGGNGITYYIPQVVICIQDFGLRSKTSKLLTSYVDFYLRRSGRQQYLLDHLRSIWCGETGFHARVYMVSCGCVWAPTLHAHRPRIAMHYSCLHVYLHVIVSPLREQVCLGCSDCLSVHLRCRMVNRPLYSSVPLWHRNLPNTYPQCLLCHQHGTSLVFSICGGSCHAKYVC